MMLYLHIIMHNVYSTTYIEELLGHSIAKKNPAALLCEMNLCQCLQLVILENYFNEGDLQCTDHIPYSISKYQ